MWFLVVENHCSNSCAVGANTTVGCSRAGSFSTAAKSSAITDPWAILLVCPSGVQSSSSSDQQLAVKQPIHSGLQGKRQFLCSAGQQQIVLMREGAQIALHDHGVVTLAIDEDARIVAIPVVLDALPEILPRRSQEAGRASIAGP